LESIVIGVLALLAIAGAAWLGPRVRIAAPLILVLVGIAVSLWPSTPIFIIDPEWILAGILPPLLFSAAVSVPTSEFRRDFAAISGLAVILVVGTSFIIGWILSRLIPGLDFAAGLAIGAILSPTDAVATSIVKRLGVSPRTVVVLEGESLLNDASALVLLRTAIGATAAGISLLHISGAFLYSIVVAVIIGLVVGYGNIWIRSRATDPTVNTALALTVPFVASLPAEWMEASGLVAAVVAGLITGFLGPRFLPPRFRLSDRQNWRMIEFVLEGAVFLIMGLELDWVLEDVQKDHFGIAKAFEYAIIALVLTIVIRAIYVVPLIYLFKASSDRAGEIANALQHRLVEPISEHALNRKMWGKAEQTDAETIARFRKSWRRRLADIDYFRNEQMGWREGTVIVWAGMRGAVTLAAAQTLPRDTPSRSLLVFIAFLVAAMSLLIQGSTLPWLAKRILPPSDQLERSNLERIRLTAALRSAGTVVLEQNGLDPAAPFPDLVSGPMPPATVETREDQRSMKQIQLDMIEEQRKVLLAAMEEGTYSSELISAAMANLDADQVALELKGEPHSGHR
jgi:CPA1 family monovalent cation:H+ antiporter